MQKLIIVNRTMYPEEKLCEIVARASEQYWMNLLHRMYHHMTEKEIYMNLLNYLGFRGLDDKYIKDSEIGEARNVVIVTDEAKLNRFVEDCIGVMGLKKNEDYGFINDGDQLIAGVWFAPMEEHTVKVLIDKFEKGIN